MHLLTATPFPLAAIQKIDNFIFKTAEMTPAPLNNIAEDALLGLANQKEGYTTLYKYQRISEYSLDALEKGYLYFSTYEQLNDPFDPFVELMKHSHDEIISSWAVRKNRVLSLTQSRDSPIMWSHYADSCAGMCIGYAVCINSESVFNKVRYEEKMTGKYNAFDLLAVKSASWAYEQEWRAILPPEQDKAYHLAYPISIHLGHKCTTENMLKIRNILPPTVKEFYVHFPYLSNSVFSYAYVQVEELISIFNRIPTVDEFVNDFLPYANIKA